VRVEVIDNISAVISRTTGLTQPIAVQQRPHPTNRITPQRSSSQSQDSTWLGQPVAAQHVSQSTNHSAAQGSSNQSLDISSRRTSSNKGESAEAGARGSVLSEDAKCSLNDGKCSLNDGKCSLNDGKCSLNDGKCFLNDAETTTSRRSSVLVVNTIGHLPTM
jgi:hypothetical protein